MSLKSSNKIETNRWELEIEVNAENFDKAIDKVYRRQVKKINIPGFRKGKVPRHFVEKYYGEEIFYEDAINALYPEVVDEAIKEAQLQVVDDEPGFELIHAGKDGLCFKVALTVKPEISIENYKGIEVESKSFDVTDEDVENEIKDVQKRNARIVEVEGRPVEKGDFVVIDFKGFVNGEAFEGGEGENYSLEIGSNQFIPGFEDQIIGHNKDEKFTIDVTFPEEYQAPELCGKEAQFEIKLHEIKTREIEPLNDEFVKDVSECDTVDEYKEHVKKELTEKKEKESEEYYNSQMFEKLSELVKGDIPEAMFRNRVNHNMQKFAYKLKSQGLDFNTYLSYMGLTQEKFKETMRPSAEMQVKLNLALEKIVELEKLEVTEDELKAYYDEMAEKYKLDVEKMKKLVAENDVKYEITMKKALNLVRDNLIKK